MEEHGLGCIPSPYDENDYPISRLYALVGAPPPPPPDYMVPGEPGPILNQGSTPQCVAYSTAGVKQYEDKLDQGQWFNFNENLFFSRIGGGSNGAFLRDAMAQLLKVGYPVVSIDDSAQHRIDAYYAVPVSLGEVQAALMAFGPLVFGVDWPNSWFHPVKGVLPQPDYSAGGHAIKVIGWRTVNGQVQLILANSWGTGYGDAGRCYMPSPYLNRVFEVWKTVDQVIAPPDPYAPRTAVNFTAIAPTRVVDSRISQGLSGPLEAATPTLVQIAGKGGVPDDAVAVTGNVTAINPSAGGFLSITPVVGVPTTSTVNFPAHDTRANSFTLGLDAQGKVTLYYGTGPTGGTVQVAIDLTGYFS
jgi:hypothetical protein